MSAQRHLCCAFGIIWASLDGFSQNQRNLHGVGISHGKSIAQSPRQPRMTRESAILIHSFKPESHSGRMVRTQPGLPRPCRPNPAPLSPYRAHADAIHTHSRQISPSSPTIAHMKIALSTAAPELRTCIDVGHGLHALLGVQVAASRGVERDFDQLCTADATSSYCERSTHSSVLGSSIDASAQSAMVLLCQAGDRAASYWPRWMLPVVTVRVTPA